MQSASRDALAELGKVVDAVVARFSTIDGVTGLAEELYAVSGLLTREPRLRRRLADPAAPVEERRGLANALFSPRLSPSAMTVLDTAVTQRWSGMWDLVDAIELSGDDVLLTAAAKDDVMDSVEDELFRLERILDNESGLTTLLDEATVPGDTRAKLLEGLITGKVHPITLALVRQAVRTERKRGILLAIDNLIDAAGSERRRMIARVISAVELTDQQQGDLADQLSALYGRRVDVRYAIDPAIRGGLVVRVGDEVIDGSVTSKLDQIRQAFAS